MEVQSCRRSVRGVRRRRVLVADPRVGSPPAPDLSNRGVPADLVAAGSRGEGVGSGGEQEAVAGAACGRRRRRVEGGDGGRPAGGWVLAA
jgi:hypothetical protein